MKNLITILIFISISLPIFCQESPILNFGTGIPFSYHHINFPYSGGSVTFGNDRIYLFIEKPESFEIVKNSNLFMSPGIAYIRLNERERNGAFYKNYTRSAASLYAKFFYKISYDPTKNHYWYTGLITGVYLYTHQSGINKWTIYQNGSEYSGFEKIDGDSKSFFKTFNAGVLAGFRFKFQSLDFLKPAIEFAFYPEYANIFDSYSVNFGKNVSKSMLTGSIILGFGTKKAAQK